MSTAYDCLTEHFSSRGLRFQAIPDEKLVIAGFGGQHVRVTLFLQLTDEERLLQVFAFPGVVVPNGARKLVAELVARANYGLKLGKFELDMDDGELRYQAANVIGTEPLSDEPIRILVAVSLHSLEKYIPAVLACIYGNEDPAEAYRMAANAP